MEPRGHDLTLDLFPIQLPCKADGEWFLRLYAAVQTTLQIDPSFVPSQGGGGRGSLSGAEDAIGGIRIRGIKKRSYGEFLQVDYALFGADGKVLVWCMSLDPTHPAPLHDLEFRNAQNQFLVLDDALKARVKALKTGGAKAGGAKAGAKAGKTPKAAKEATPANEAAAFSAEFPLRAIAVSHGAVAGTDTMSNLYLWDAATGALRWRAKAGAGGMKSIHQIAFSPKGSYVAVGAGAVNVFEVATGKALVKVPGHPKGEVWGIQYSRDGRFIATASRGAQGTDNSVALWDSSTGDPIKKWPYKQPGRSCTWVAFSPDSTSLVFAVEHPPSLHRIDLAKREVVAHVALAPEGSPWTVSVESLAWTTRGLAIVVERELLLCDPLTLEPMKRVPIEASRPFLVPTPDGKRLLVGRQEVSVVDLETLSIERTLPASPPDCQGIATDGTHVYLASGPRVFVDKL